MRPRIKSIEQRTESRFFRRGKTQQNLISRLRGVTQRQAWLSFSSSEKTARDEYRLKRLQAEFSWISRKTA